jgi:hypothetical protein
MLVTGRANALGRKGNTKKLKQISVIKQSFEAFASFRTFFILIEIKEIES